MATKEEISIKFFLLSLLSIPAAGFWALIASGAQTRGSTVDDLAIFLTFITCLLSFVICVAVTIRTHDSWWCLVAIINFISLGLYFFPALVWD